eukprot:10960541-Ditylum_brightwellii.AAC.1
MTKAELRYMRMLKPTPEKKRTKQIFRTRSSCSFPDEENCIGIMSRSDSMENNNGFMMTTFPPPSMLPITDHHLEEEVETDQLILTSNSSDSVTVASKPNVIQFSDMTMASSVSSLGWDGASLGFGSSKRRNKKDDEMMMEEDEPKEKLFTFDFERMNYQNTYDEESLQRLDQIPSLATDPESHHHHHHQVISKSPSSDSSGSKKQKVFVLLIKPAVRIYEVIQVKYSSDSENAIHDILQAIPEKSTEPRLATQRYRGLCRHTD